MRPVFHCRACGFISTLGSEFNSRAGVLLDRQCLDAFERGEEPTVTWVREALAMEAATAGETCNRLDPKGDSAGPKDNAQPLGINGEDHG